jgi:hypothetical protein
VPEAVDIPIPSRKPVQPRLDLAAVVAPAEPIPVVAPRKFDLGPMVPPPEPRPSVAAPGASEPPRSASTEERLAWVRAKYATRREELAGFLERYPSSEFADEARTRLALLTQDALSRFNGTWRSIGQTGCAFTGIMELNRGAFTLTLKQAGASKWAMGEIDEEGSIEKVRGSSENLAPSGRFPNISVAPFGCRFEFALVDSTPPVLSKARE